MLVCNYVHKRGIHPSEIFISMRFGFHRFRSSTCNSYFQVSTSSFSGLFVHNALHGRGPTYLSCTCIPVSEVSARAHLRSAVQGDLTVPRTKTHRFGPRSFRVSGPVVWKSLPEGIQNPELSLEHFKSMLKTHLFRLGICLAALTVLCDLVKGRLISVSYIYIHLHLHSSS